MKPEYTYDDLLTLGDVTDRFFDDQDQSYYNLMKDTVIKEATDVLDGILDFLGCYLCAMPRHIAFKFMEDFLFREDLHDFPLYINSSDSDSTLWKVIIARWRLQIGK